MTSEANDAPPATVASRPSKALEAIFPADQFRAIADYGRALVRGSTRGMHVLSQTKDSGYMATSSARQDGIWHELYAF